MMLDLMSLTQLFFKYFLNVNIKVNFKATSEANRPNIALIFWASFRSKESNTWKTLTKNEDFLGTTALKKAPELENYAHIVFL